MHCKYTFRSKQLVSRAGLATLVMGAILGSTILTIPVRADEPVRIALKPLAPVNTADVASVRKAVVARFRVAVDVLPPSKLPQSAYYAPRNRYRADILLDWLDKHADKKYAKVVGLTARDISVTKGDVYDWGIFGLGAIDQRPCLISTFRLGRGVGETRRRERLQKVVLHEVGHTFGLGHCPAVGCTMADAQGSIKSVDAETGFCKRCVASLGPNLRP